MGSCGQGLPVSRHSSSQQGVTMGKGQNEGEGGFSEEQIQMYKDCFKLMDVNKEGTLDKNDLRGAFDNIGVLMSESELDDLMGEVSVLYDDEAKAEARMVEVDRFNSYIDAIYRRMNAALRAKMMDPMQLNLDERKKAPKRMK